MRRICMFLMLLCLLLSGCGILAAGSFDTDREIARNTLEELAQACKDRDIESLEQLFSPNALAEAANFAEDAQALFAHFDGNVVSNDDWGGPTAEGGHQDGEAWNTLWATFDVTTSSGSVRLALALCVQDTKDPENVGIESLYVIRAEDSDQESAYWGGWEWLPGIHIQGTEKQREQAGSFDPA